MAVDNPLDLWFQTTLFLYELSTVRKVYNEVFRLLPTDIQEAIRNAYFCDLCHSLDLLLCMLPYRDLQYGPSRARKLRRRMKLWWIAYNIHVAQKLLNEWSNVKKELREWYRGKGRQC